MKTIHPEIHEEYEGHWRAGCVIEENGMLNCPGLDEYYDNRDDAVAAAQDIAEYYFDGCMDTETEAQLGELIEMR